MNRTEDGNAEAGPSRRPAPPPPVGATQEVETIEVPSSGPEFFEYRRRLFLAGLPLPVPPRDRPLPPTITVALPLPDPLPSIPFDPSPKSSVGKLQALFDADGAEDRLETWNNLQGVLRNLSAGKALNRPLRLGLIIKILKVGWIRDGTWPVDPKTAASARPPDSPPPGAPMEVEVETPGISPPTPGLAGLMGYGYGDAGSSILWPANVSVPKEVHEVRNFPGRNAMRVAVAGDEEMGNDHG